MLDPFLLNYYVHLKDGLALSDLTMNHAILIHEKVLKSKIKNGLDPLTLASSCVYFVSKYRDTPRTLKQVNMVGGISRRDIARCYRLLIKNNNTIGFMIP